MYEIVAVSYNIAAKESLLENWKREPYSEEYGNLNPDNGQNYFASIADFYILFSLTGYNKTTFNDIYYFDEIQGILERMNNK